MSKKFLLLARGTFTPIMNIKQKFSCTGPTSMRRPLDQTNDFERQTEDSETKNEYSAEAKGFETGFSASEYEGPGEKSINQVTLLGRVGLEPQIRGSEENPVTTFNMATNSSWRNMNPRAGDSEWNKRTDWHNVVVFKPGLRELAYNNIVKGARIHVTGKLMYGEYLDRQGVKRQTTSIVCDDIIFLSAKKDNY